MTATHPDQHAVDGRGDDHDGCDHASSDERPKPPPSRFRQPFRGTPMWVAPVAVGAAALGSCIYVGLVDPNTSSSALYPQCAFKALTGYDCPGCGLTRAMHAVVTGHPMRALDHNILIALILPLAVYTYAVWLTKALFGWDLPYVRIPKPVAYAMVPLVAAFWVVRNLPFGPFTYLNSTAAGA